MRVVGIGNVTECNRAYIFLNEEGTQSRETSTTEKLQMILEVARGNITFYERMMREIKEEYDKKKEKVNKARFITDEEIEECRKAGKKEEAFHLSLMQESTNREWQRKFASVYGFFGGFNYALDKKEEARKLLAQAEEALKRI